MITFAKPKTPGRRLVPLALGMAAMLAVPVRGGPEGTVVSLRGEPVNRAALTLMEVTPSGARMAGFVVTDRDGAFSFGTSVREVSRSAVRAGGHGVRIRPHGVRFQDPAAVHSARVLDIAGRSLWRMRAAGGMKRLAVWDLRTSGGRVADGVYVAAAAGGSGRTVRRFLVRDGAPLAHPSRTAEHVAAAGGLGKSGGSGLWLMAVEPASGRSHPCRDCHTFDRRNIRLATRDTTLRVSVNLLPEVIDTPLVLFTSASPDSGRVPLDSVVFNDGCLMVVHGDSARYSREMSIRRPTRIISQTTGEHYPSDVQESVVYDAEHFLTAMFGVTDTPEELEKRFGPFPYDTAGYLPGDHAVSVPAKVYDSKLMAHGVPYFRPGGEPFCASREERIEELTAFLASDSTDTNTYRVPGYDCVHFTRDLVRAAVQNGIPLYPVSAMESDGESHAFGALLVGDSIGAFGDWLFVEPQSDAFTPGGRPIEEYFADANYFHIWLPDPATGVASTFALAQGTKDSIRVLAQPFENMGITVPPRRPGEWDFDELLRHAAHNGTAFLVE